MTLTPTYFDSGNDNCACIHLIYVHFHTDIDSYRYNLYEIDCSLIKELTFFHRKTVASNNSNTCDVLCIRIHKTFLCNMLKE